MSRGVSDKITFKPYSQEARWLLPPSLDEFIHRLCAETEATEECFLKHKAVYDSTDSDLEQQTREELRRLLVGEQVVVPIVSNKLMDEILWSAYTLGSVALDSELVKQIEEQIEKLKTPISVKEGRNNLRRKLKTDGVFRAKFQHLLWLIAKSPACQNLQSRKGKRQSLSLLLFSLGIARNHPCQWLLPKEL